MYEQKTNRLIGILAIPTIVLCLSLFPTSAFAIGGDEKSPEEKAQENEKKAIEAYNSGHEHMAKAREYGIASDSLFAFNYRATSDAKARREYEKAVKKFDKAIELNPKFYEALSDRGYCQRKIGDFLEALHSYNEALKINSEYAPAIEYRGEAYLALDSLDAANETLQKLKAMAASAEVDSLKLKYTAYADTLSLSIDRYNLTQFEKKSKETK